MDACLRRCRIFYADWKLGELHVCGTQRSPASLQWLLVSVLLVRRITPLQSVVSGIELLRERGPVRALFQLFSLLQHEVQGEYDVLVLSKLATNGRPDRLVIPVHRSKQWNDVKALV